MFDRLSVSVIPHLLGGGIYFFKEGIPEQNLLLRQSIAYTTGLVQLGMMRYNKVYNQRIDTFQAKAQI